jgi:predicted transcriptional regulator
MRFGLIMSEVGHGLRRNFSMVVSVVLVTFISLTFVGAAILLQFQIGQMKGYWYDRAQVAVYMCTSLSTDGNCKLAEATKDQKALVEAQRLGYAEADPAEDVDGRDAAAKMAILARLAFDTPVHLDQVRYEGIEQIQPDDLEYARELGLGLKLIGTAERVGEALSVRVHPAFLYPGHPLASVGGPFNAVTVESPAITEITSATAAISSASSRP